MTPPWTAVRLWAQTMFASMEGWSLFVIIVLAFTGDYLVLEFGLPTVLRRIPEVIIGFLLIHRLADSRLPWRLPAAFSMLGVTVLVAAVAALLADQEMLRTATGARNLLRYPLLALVVANLRLTSQMRTAVWNLLFVLLAIQVPWAVYQWGVLGREDDGVFGTLRSTGSLGVLMLVAVLAVCAQTVYMHRRLTWLLVLPLAALPPMLGDGKAFFLLIPLALVTALLGTVRRRPLIAVAVAAIGLVSMGYMATQFQRVQGQDDIIAFIAAKIADPLTDSGLAGDVSQTSRIDELIDASLTAFTRAGFGEGLGSRTVFFREVEDEFTATRTLLTTSMSVRLQELGAIGTALYLMALCTAGLSCWRLVRHARSPWDAFTAAVAAFVVVVTVPVHFYTNVDVPSVALMLWLPIGMALGVVPPAEPQAVASPLRGGTAPTRRLVLPTRAARTRVAEETR